MKKNSAFISTIALSLALTLTLSGCAEQKNNSGSPSPSSETGLIDDISVSEASAEPAPSSSDALSEPFDGIDSYAELCFGYTSDGKYEALDLDEYSSVIYAQYMASEEFYNMAQEYGEYEDMSYEEFKEEMYSNFDIDPSAAEKYSKYSMFAALSYYGENEYADHSAAAKKGFDFFVQKLLENSSFSADTLGEDKTIYVDIGQQGDIISVSAFYKNKDGESKYILENELVCILGDNYILVGTTAVPKDTRSLYISDSDEKMDSWIGDYSEEKYEAAVFEYYGSWDSRYSSDYDEREPFDLTKIAEQLPSLEKLYVSTAIPIIGFEGLEKYDDFSELDISVWSLSEESSLNIVSALSNIGTLRVRDIESTEEAELLTDVKAGGLAINCSCGRDDDLLKFIYTIPNVTELEMHASFTHETADLNGIDAMTALKKLFIAGFDMVDYAPLSRLNALEELIIIGNNGVNYDSIGKIKTLRSLTMYGLHDKNGDDSVDLSVLSNCTSVEYLDIYHVDKSLYSAFQYMTNLKKIKFGVGSGFYYGLGEVANAVSVEELIIENNDHVNLRGISNLTNLKSLTLTNCGFENISELGDCSALKTLIIDCKDKHTFDADYVENNTQIEELYLKNVRFMHYKSLKTLTALKKLTLISTDLTEEQIDDLRKDMTWCEIEAVLPEKEKNENGEEASEAKENDKAVSFAEPLKTVYIDNIRVETYAIDDDYYGMTLYIKNCGEEPLESLTEFMEKNGLLDGCDQMNILYPAYDDHSEVTEIFELNEKGIDYESSEVYLSVLVPYEEDYIENDLFRKLVPGCEARIILHLKDDDSETE